MSRHWSKPGWAETNVDPDPSTWTPAEWIIFTTPVFLGPLMRRWKTGKWGWIRDEYDMYIWMMFTAAQGAAYSAVGIATIAPSATLAQLRRVVSAGALKAVTPKYRGPPLGSLAGPMLIWPNVLSVASMFESPPRLD